ncbi:MAG: sugar transferase [Nitrospinae bacterium]|nr:sugar transferase [Nitrospinota bacterium]
MSSLTNGRVAFSEDSGLAAMDAAKRVFDLLFAPVILLICLPIFIVVAGLIRMGSDGPVFFLQKRSGRNGRRFRMYKFRTMERRPGWFQKTLASDTDGPMFKKKDDPRVTPIGKVLRRLSLDEIPQLINVLKGDMSLVGPRPLAWKEMAGHEQWRNVRLSVRPGLTGLWQVKGRGTGRFEDWVKYDMEYVANWSLAMDIKILFMTAQAVINKRGAH